MIGTLKAIIYLILGAFFTLLLCTCGSSGSAGPTPVIVIPVQVLTYLAPGASESFPTTVRLKVEILDDKLPLHSISFDPDADGPLAPQAVTPIPANKMPPFADYTGYFFDFIWEGPDGTTTYVVVDCAGGIYTSPVDLFLDHLFTWDS
jgi:hypothetical protein